MPIQGFGNSIKPKIVGFQFVSCGVPFTVWNVYIYYNPFKLRQILETKLSWIKHLFNIKQYVGIVSPTMLIILKYIT